MMLTTIILFSIINISLLVYILFTQKKQFTHNLQQSLEKELKSFQYFFSQEFKLSREEVQQQQLRFQESFLKSMSDISHLQKDQLDSFSKQLHLLMQNNEKQIHSLRESVEKRLTILQQDNNQKLEKMRATVDEKLHETLEKRLGDSFKQVSERLEHVHKGLGEMKHLATGVGDLKKVLSNVKTRGIWGEVQCASLLEQVLSPDQYDSQVRIRKNSSEHVDFAIKLPGKSSDLENPVWLPIDAKFPLDAYQYFIESQESGDKEAIALQEKQLVTRIKNEAKSIKDKYIEVPYTTDFAIMYLPTESLYADILRFSELQDILQHRYKILVAGPTTLAALLNSLQMGFKTVAIEKRSSEVWSILSAVKVEFNKFGDILDKTQKKLQEAGNTIEKATSKSRTIERKLKNVEELPIHAETPLFEAPTLQLDQIQTL
ncbi:DNA recombination protein RmuC [Candidatus Marinamargulisbacteria bacterium SCGC AG-343-D04]|nr:DNA recombination protein RmuC [Candidatus Marinamargulisbacteria bacterium SCGC AG-343-D04]